MNSSCRFLGIQLKLGQAFSLACLIEFGPQLPIRNGRAPQGTRGPFPFGEKTLLSPAFLGLVDHAFFRYPFASIDESMTTWSQRMALMSLELGFLRQTSTSLSAAWPRTTRMQKPQTTSEKVNTPPDGFIVSTDRPECCIWCCRMGHLSSEGKWSPGLRRGWRRDRGRRGGRYAGTK